MVPISPKSTTPRYNQESAKELVLIHKLENQTDQKTE